jgi:hypothetical protein
MALVRPGIESAAPVRAMSFGITRDERQAVMDCPYNQQDTDHGTAASSAGEMAPAVGDLLIEIRYPTSPQLLEGVR